MARYTNKNAGKYVEKMLSSARRWNGCRALFNTWEDNFGRTFVCDGFRAYRLEKAPEGYTTLWCYKRLTDAEISEYDRVHSAVEDMFDLPDLTEIPAPELDAVKAVKAGEDPVFDLGEHFPCVNADYLLDALELLPGCRLYCCNGFRRMVSPVYVVSNDGIALILPVRRAYKMNAVTA